MRRGSPIPIPPLHLAVSSLTLVLIMTLDGALTASAHHQVPGKIAAANSRKYAEAQIFAKNGPVNTRRNP